MLVNYYYKLISFSSVSFQFKLVSVQCLLSVSSVTIHLIFLALSLIFFFCPVLFKPEHIYEIYHLPTMKLLMIGGRSFFW